MESRIRHGGHEEQGVQRVSKARPVCRWRGIGLRAIALLLVVNFAVTGCGRTGPQLMRSQRALYNHAVQQTGQEQLLLNIARLRYRENPLFLEIASVSSSFEIETEGNAGATIPEQGIEVFTLGAGGRFMEVPTVTYTPLLGQRFAKQLLTPVDLSTLVLLYHSGWSVERLLRLAAQQIGRVANAPSASGPTPETTPAYRDFQELVGSLRALQRDRRVEALVHEDGDRELLLRISPTAVDSPEWQRILQLLELPSDARRIELTSNPEESDPDDVRIVTRSLAGVLFYVSQGVRVPEEDEQAGRVTVTRTDTGERFDWKLVTGDLFTAEWSQKEPKEHPLRARYRGQWFFVDDSDLSSKSTFSLLLLWFQLQSNDITSGVPVLTLPVAR